jgi:hypothetical protein
MPLTRTLTLTLTQTRTLTLLLKVAVALANLPTRRHNPFTFQLLLPMDGGGTVLSVPWILPSTLDPCHVGGRVHGQVCTAPPRR